MTTCPYWTIQLLEWVREDRGWTYADLLAQPDRELLRMRGFGPVRLALARKWLEDQVAAEMLDDEQGGRVDRMTRPMAMPEAERETYEALEVSVRLRMVRSQLSGLPLQSYLVVVMSLIEDAKQRCADEGTAWPPMG